SIAVARSSPGESIVGKGAIGGELTIFPPVCPTPEGDDEGWGTFSSFRMKKNMRIEDSMSPVPSSVSGRWISGRGSSLKPLLGKGADCSIAIAQKRTPIRNNMMGK